MASCTGDGMRIGEAAAAAGTTPRALRFYEQRGLLPEPARTASGQRDYGPFDVAVVRTIRELLALGLTVEDLRVRAPRLQTMARDPGAVCGSGRPAGSFGDVVEHRLAALDAEISRLTRLRAELARRAASSVDQGDENDHRGYDERGQESDYNDKQLESIPAVDPPAFRGVRTPGGIDLDRTVPDIRRHPVGVDGIEEVQGRAPAAGAIPVGRPHGVPDPGSVGDLPQDVRFRSDVPESADAAGRE